MKDILSLEQRAYVGHLVKTDLEGIIVWQKCTFYQKPDPQCCFISGDLQQCIAWLLGCFLGLVSPSHRSTEKTVRWNHRCFVS